MKALPWIVTGVGAATAIVGWGVIGSMANAQQSDDPDEQNAAHDKAVVADILGIAGCAIAAGGAVWGIVSLVKGGKEDEGGSSAKVVPYADQKQAGLSATFTF
jgi:hypothetical protein